MDKKIIQITSEPVGVGKERVCYLHPGDPNKIIKLQKGNIDKQTKREVHFYKKLLKRKNIQYTHLPKYYGPVTTNLGDGFAVDFITDYDGSISKSINWHFKQGFPVTEFAPYLEELKNYFLDNLIIFNVDMGKFNLLFQKISPNKARIVVIDGIGDHSFITWLNAFGSLARRKIHRRWDRFINKLHRYSYEMVDKKNITPRKIDACFRRDV